MMFGAHFFPLTRLWRKFVEFVQLPCETLAFQLQLAIAVLREFHRMRCVAPDPMRPRYLLCRVEKARVGIEELALSVRAHQQLMGVLAVDVDEHLAQFTQLHERGRRTVDERPRTSA